MVKAPIAQPRRALTPPKRGACLRGRRIEWQVHPRSLTDRAGVS